MIEFIDSLPCPHIDSMAKFLTVTIAAAVVGIILLLTPVGDRP